MTPEALSELERLEREATAAPQPRLGDETPLEVFNYHAALRNAAPELLAAARRDLEVRQPIQREGVLTGCTHGTSAYVPRCDNHVIEGLKGRVKELEEKREHAAKANHQAHDEIRKLQMELSRTREAVIEARRVIANNCRNLLGEADEWLHKYAEILEGK